MDTFKRLLPLLCAAALVAAAQAQTRYTVRNIGMAQMNGIGDDGTAQGVSIVTGNAVAWNQTYGMIAVPPIVPPGYCASFDVNAAGRIVGYCDTDLGGGHSSRDAFVWTPGQGTFKFHDFGNVPSEAYGINALGHIVGRYYVGTPKYDSFLWRSPGDLTILPRLNSGFSTQALAVNVTDWVVGYAGMAFGDIHAVLWKPGQPIHDLGLLEDQTQTDPTDINDNGTVTGTTYGPQGLRGFLLYSDGTWVKVPNPVWSIAQTYPRGMNDSDAVAGDLMVSQGVNKAFVWTPWAGTRALNDLLDPTALGWDITYAGGINDHGQICGLGKFSGQLYGVVLDPVLVPVAPTSFTVSLGKKSAGDVSSLASVDGNVLRVCKFIVPNLFVAPINVQVDGTFTSGNCLGVTFRTVSRMQQAGSFSQTLELWDWTTGDWDTTAVRTDPVNLTFATRDLVASGDTRRLLKGDGSLRARYRIKQSGPAATIVWRHEMDQAEWLIAP